MERLNIFGSCSHKTRITDLHTTGLSESAARADDDAKRIVNASKCAFTTPAATVCFLYAARNLKTREGLRDRVPLDPSRPGYWAARAVVLISIRRRDEAVEAAQQGVSIAAADRDAEIELRSLLAVALNLRNDQWEEARGELEKVSKIAAAIGDTETEWNANLEIAQNHGDSGAPEKDLEIAKRVLDAMVQKGHRAIEDLLSPPRNT